MFLDMVKTPTRRLEHTLVDCGLEMQTHCTLSKAYKSTTSHADPLDPLN